MNKAKRNIVSTLISQLVTTMCGVVIPIVMISVFGSAMYGLTTSIAQFLSYISLLEGGIARVARAELYVPLVRNDNYEVSRVYHAIKRFFTFVGVAFLGYTLLMSLVYFDIAQVTDVGRTYTFFMIWVISAGTLAKYMGGISNLTLLNADQKQYVGNVIVTIATILNALFVVVLSKAGCDLLVVKIGSSLVYMAQPVCYSLYVKKHYKLPPVGKDISKLQQKWTGMGQHIAYFLHTNTDVVILTLFADLRSVAVYSVYRLVISSIRKITASFSSGMEAAFGEKIAKNEHSALLNIFFKYKHMLSFVSLVLFGTTAVLVVPFVRLYTAGVTDADYIQPVFAVVLLFAEAIDCFMHPCCSLPISANKLRETRWGSYGEAAINVVLSLVMVQWSPLVGIALATLVATVFKSIYYMHYSAKHILRIRFGTLLKNYLIINGSLGLFALAGIFLMANIQMASYFVWFLWGIVVFSAVSIISTAVYSVFYPLELKAVLLSVAQKVKR